MQLHHSLDDLHLSDSWVTIGSFDGVHIGHQALIKTLVESAHSAGLPAVVISFHPHPAVFLREIKGPFYLTDQQERAHLIRALGVDHLVELPFDHSLAETSAVDFMKQISDHLGIRHLLAGSDFKLGKGREGNAYRLAEIGKELGYLLEILEPTSSMGGTVSSSRIRSYLISGDVESAAVLLGRSYHITGEVIRGDGRGREMGFPTANLKVGSQRMLPMKGVYATLSGFAGRNYLSVTNIGYRPTFTVDPALQIESHLLDFDEDIYHQQLRVSFHKLLRTEQQFGSSRELIDQIKADISSARKVLPNG